MLHCDFKLKRGNVELEVQFALNKGETVGIEGHSGAGKSTILNVIAGFVVPKVGEVRCDNQVWFKDGRTKLKSGKRKIGYVFQQAALFPTMTLQENLKFAINDNAYLELAERLAIDKLLNHYPHELSGGQQQRGCIARSLLTKPRLLLLDEVTSSLDEKNKEIVINELKNYHSKNECSMIVVSHDKMVLNELCSKFYYLESNDVEQKYTLTERRNL